MKFGNTLNLSPTDTYESMGVKDEAHSRPRGKTANSAHGCENKSEGDKG